MNFLSVCVTSVASYLALFAMAKLMGHKQISQLDSFDYITGITIGSIAAEMATELEAPWKPLVAMVIYTFATLLMGFLSRKLPRTRKYLNGTAVILMDKGKLLRENFQKAKLDLNEFLVMCRELGYFDLASIETAVFEPNGALSVLPKSALRPATPKDLNLSPAQETLFTEVIMDGRVLEENLQKLGLDHVWLKKQLQRQGFDSAKDVFLGICDRNKNVQFYKSER